MPDLIKGKMKTPPEVVEALLGRVPLSVGDFERLAEMDYRATAAAFTASGLPNLSLVARLQRDLAESIAQGESLGSFKARVKGRLREKMSEAALELTYRVNVHSAYMGGRWEGIKSAAEDFPYLRYDALDDGRTRPEHKALDGLIYPVGSEFWQSHYPPNGFRCRCNVSQVSAGEAERKGLTVSTTPPASLPQPDAGWNTNQAEDQLGFLQRIEAQRLEGVPLDFARNYILNKNRRDPSFNGFARGGGIRGEMRPVAVLPPAAQEVLGSQSQLVCLSTDTAKKQAISHPELPLRSYFSALGKALDSGAYIKDQDGSLVYFSSKGKTMVAVVKATKSGKRLFLKSLRYGSEEEIARIARRAGGL